MERSTPRTRHRAVYTSWRRGWDSNPRATLAAADFQDRCLQPLGHPSRLYFSSTYSICVGDATIYYKYHFLRAFIRFRCKRPGSSVLIGL